MNPFDLLRIPFTFICDLIRLAEIKKDRATFREQVIDLQLERDTLHRQLDVLTIERNSLLGELVDLKSEVVDLRSQINDLRSSNYSPQRNRRDYDPYK